MNIRNLLKKLETNDNQNKIMTPYQIKTIQSLGTVNSQHTQQSFVIHDGPTHNRSNNSALSVYSKIDQELSEIDKMKKLYESRRNRSRHNARSIERSQSKSIEKHGLKPSNTPSFNKFGKMVSNQEKLRLSACRNLYQQELQEKECESTCQNRQAARKRTPYEQIYYKAEQLQEESLDPYEQDPNENQNPAINDQELLKQLSMQQTPIKNHQCHCQQQLSLFMGSLEMKLNQFEKRIQYLQHQNKQIREINGMLSNKVNSLGDAVEEVKIERNQAQFRNRELKQEKEELEQLLKDVLYRRQRQKIVNSKQNTHRQNHRKPCITNNPNKCQLNMEKMDSHSPKPKGSESKMKVENLLKKLQIKIDRV